MAHDGIFCTSDEITNKIGTYNTTTWAEADINALCLQCEAIINSMCKYNFSDNYASLNADYKHILSDAESCWCAATIIASDLLSYKTQREAETMLDWLWTNWTRDIEILQDKIYQDKINAV